MTKTEIWEKIKTSNVKTFRAFDPIDKLTYRCAIEENGSIFVYAKKKKRYGWRYSEEVFLRNFEPILPTDENLKWKRRLKRAVKLCKASGLWEEIAVIWDNLYKYVTLEEKNKIYDMSWDNRDAAIAYCKEHYPFMIKTDSEGKEYLNTSYIWELSRCELKSMYFGYYNAEEKEQIRKALAEHRQYTIPRVRVNYDVSFSYNPDINKAWYSEEYKDCGNGHYYLALDHSTAVFCEDD